MSLTRQLFRDMRPLFRMFDEPFRTPAYMGFPQTSSLLDEPFFRYPTSLRPAVDVSEQGNNYVVEAELPGVKKENVQVRIGDGGRSVTIEGKVVEKSPETEGQAATDATTETAPATEGTYPALLSVTRYSCELRVQGGHVRTFEPDHLGSLSPFFLSDQWPGVAAIPRTATALCFRPKAGVD